MAKIPYQDPLSSEVQSPLIAGAIEGLSKVSETVGMDTEELTDVQMIPVQFLDEDDPYRIYQVTNGDRIWLSSPAPVIKLNGSIMSTSTYNYSIDCIGGSITFVGDYRPKSSDKITVSCTHVIKGSDFANKVLSGVEEKNNSLENKVNQTVSEVNSNIANVNTQISNLDSRVNNIIADGQQTDGNTELIDIRNGFDGTKYTTAGEGIRSQILDIWNTVGDFHKFSFKEPPKSTGINWNVPLGAYPSGTTIVAKLTSYGGNYLKDFRIVLYPSDKSAAITSASVPIGTEARVTIEKDVSNGFLQIIRTEVENTSASLYYRTNYGGETLTSRVYEINNFVNMALSHSYTVTKDGSGDFDSLIDAISSAEKYFQSTVYIGPGTWDLISELGEDYLNEVSATQRGVVLKNKIHLIFDSNSIVTCHYTGDREETINWLSAFNAGEYGFTLENCTLQSSKCRYSIHDERDQDTDFYQNQYLNCNIQHDPREGGLNQCIGGGLGQNGYILIDGCIFNNLRNLVGQNNVSYHNTGASTGKSRITIKNCYFMGNQGLRFGYYGTSPTPSDAVVCGCSLPAAISVVPETTESNVENINLISFGNEIRS